MQVKNKYKVEWLKSSGFVQGTGRADWTGVFFFLGLVSVANILKSYEPLIRSESRLYHLLIR